MTPWRHRLWWRIWLATIGAIVVVALLSVTAWRLFLDPARLADGTPSIAAAAAAQLPPADVPEDAQNAALERARAKSEVDFALFDATGRLVARAGRPVPPPRLDEEESHWVGWRAPRSALDDGDRLRLPAFALRLSDGRWLVARRSLRSLRRPIGAWPGLILLALAVAAGTYPIVRRLTRRLERLQESVQRLGGGDLATRVAVVGHDEVARLAASFNEAATRIESLVQAHRSLLANASHELRSPLARVRMGLELSSTGKRPEIVQELARDIAELDALIDEILLMSRLDAAADAQALRDRFETVDLAALAAEESARADASFVGETVLVSGDARLLRRLVRNLLDNARRYGGSAPVEVALERSGATARLEVRDRGPGVAEAERERIFAPFYRAQGASESAGGVGLGLALVRTIARQHGGEAFCLAREAGGSVFRITLPAA